MRAAIFLALAVLLAGCSSTDDGTATPTATTKTTVSGSPIVSSTPGATPTGSPTPSTPAVVVSTTPPPPTPTSPPLSGTRILRINDYVFEPGDLVVARGTVVEIENHHVLSHTVTAVDGSFDTANIKAGEEFELPMNILGTFPYYCKLHPQMRGNLTVVQPPPEVTPTVTPSPVVNESQQDATIFDFDFRPRAPVWDVGTQVTWTNTGSRTHTVTADDGSFDSGNIAQNGKFTATFTQAGTYAYHCKIHATMKGTIVIE